MSTTTTSYNPNSINIRLFHYTKGSVDYPINHGVGDKFGFNDDTSEVPIYNYTIKDIITNIENTKTVDNIYTINTDRTFDVTVEDGVSIISNRNKDEKISSFIFDLGESDTLLYENAKNYIERINPNFDIVSEEIAEGNAELEGSSHNIFWSKMFAFIEMLKKYEQSISYGKFTTDINDANGEDSDITVIKSDGTLDPNEFNKVDALGHSLENDYNILSRLDVIEAYFAMFFGRNGNETTIESTTDDSILNLERNYLRDNDSVWSNEDLPNFWLRNKSWISGAPVELTLDDPEDANNNLDVRYDHVHMRLYSAMENRISRISFKMMAKLYDFTTGSGFVDHTFNFTVYFDPEEFILDNLKQSSYEVFTYNDLNPDPESTGDEPRIGFNIYDNDYANMLSEDVTKRNTFNVSHTEFNNQIMREIQKRIITGQYKNYTAVPINRISPYIDTDTDTIVFDSENVTAQTFYVFHKQSIPGWNVPTPDANDAIKKYLINLHRECTNTKYENGKLKFIGHGTGDSEVNAFLIKMYPELFEIGTLNIVPVSVYKDGVVIDNIAKAKDLGNYKTVYTIEDIDDTISKVDDKYSLTAFPNLEFSSEILHVGLTNSQSDSSVENLTVPFMCITDTGSKHPFTSNIGFENYVPLQMSNDSVVDSDDPSVKFQIIVNKLYQMSFTSDENTNPVSSVENITMEYSHDISYTNSDMSTEFANVVSFTLNSITYRLYALPNLYYCNIQLQYT